MDYGHAQTDKMLQMLLNKINTNYKAAQKYVQKKANTALKKFEKADKEQQKLLKKKMITQNEYIDWRAKNILASSYLKDLSESLAADLSNANQIATKLVNGDMPDIFALNANYGTYEIDKMLGVQASASFSLYDRDTVIRLMRKNPEIVPKANIKIPKDKVWNRRKIYSAMSQGILAGDSIPHIADRLQKVTDMNRRAAIRNARTYTTAAENGGRIDAYERAEEMGITIKQEWMATVDERTRESHIQMDGEQIEIGGTFSNGLRYPGDPAGAPEEIYNCRCTLVAADPEFSKEDAEMLAERFMRLPDGMTYEQWKYGKEYGDIAALEDQLSKAQAKLASVPNKTYSGIWKNDVTLADYEAKKGSIKAKADWYNDKIKKLEEDEKDQGFLTGWQQNDLKEYKQHLKDLDEFKKQGALYSQYRDEVTSLNDKLKALRGDTSPFGPDAYSEARINAALRFNSKEVADKYYRPILDSQWDTLSEREKYAVWEYTHNSNPMNQPLSGYNDGWDRDRFVGVGKADWGLQDDWRNVSTQEFVDKFSKDGTGRLDYHRTISDLTKAIDKTPSVDDAWLVRGSDRNGLAGLFEGDLFSFNEAKDILQWEPEEKLKAAFEGQTFTMHSFMSTGIAEGSGFDGNVSYKIYAPKGSKIMYAEPASYYGNTISGEEIYKAGQSYSSVGYEAERIIQRGTDFRVRKIEKEGGSINVELEIVNQPDYFKYGDEETFNGGLTRHKKS